MSNEDQKLNTSTETKPEVLPEISAEIAPESKTAKKQDPIQAPQPFKKPKNPNDGPSYVWIYLALLAIIGFTFFSTFFNEAGSKQIDTIKFDNLYKRGDVARIETVNNRTANVFIKKDSLQKSEYKDLHIPANLLKEDQPIYYFNIISNQWLYDHLQALQATDHLEELSLNPREENPSWLSGAFSSILYILVFVGIWYFVMRKMNGGGGAGFPGGGLFSIGKSKAQLFDDSDENRITFAQVAGLDEEKVEVMEIVDFLKEPQKYTNLGGKIPKGALLIGPPGTGKTLLAKAMAGEAKVPFFSLSGSDFVEMFVGVGASRVRDLFRQAREKAPCIVFIDEIDAIGRARGKNVMGGNDERENTLNQLLVEMDGFGGDTGVIMIAATNRPDVLDDALLRPGRFDRQIHIDRPDIKGREQIFNVHLKPIKKGEDVDAQKLSELTPGFVGADIANVCNEAALVAARKNKEEVNMKDFNEAIDRITTGLEKKNMIIQPEEKKAIAYHESGHALTSWYLEHAHPFIRVTIIPRSESLGHALYLPKEKYLTLKEELLDRIAVSLGGRAAEQLVFGQISTGALSDLDNVTSIAYSMVTVYGMSEKVGNVSFYRMANQSYEKPYSEETAQLIDSEVRNIIDEQFKRVYQLLESKREELDKLAMSLLEKEVLHKDDLIALFGKRLWDEDKDESPENAEKEGISLLDSNVITGRDQIENELEDEREGTE